MQNQSIHKAYLQLKLDTEDLRNQYFEALNNHRKIYHPVVLDAIGQIVSDAFNHGVAMVEMYVSDSCYNDQDYYFGVQNISFLSNDKSLYGDWSYDIERDLTSFIDYNSQALKELLGEHVNITIYQDGTMEIE